jgi:hypothetical protein
LSLVLLVCPDDSFVFLFIIIVMINRMTMVDKD